MSVLAQAMAVAVRRRTIEQKYPGGLEGYRRDSPNQTFAADRHLAVVSFMDPLDVMAFIDRLEILGFAFHDDEKYLEVAVVDEREGPPHPCHWLAWEAHDGYVEMWVKGKEKGEPAAPDGWEDRETFLYVAPEEEDEWEEIAFEDGQRTVRHRTTGEERTITCSLADDRYLFVRLR
jgi:hypothetical protein